MVKYTGNNMLRIKGYSNWISLVTFSQDLILVASVEGTDLAGSDVGGGIQQELKGQSGGVNSAAFSYNSVLMASPSDDWTVRIFSYVGALIGAMHAGAQGQWWPGLPPSCTTRRS